MGSFIVWLLGFSITLVVLYVGAWFPIGILAVLGVALIWAVIVWGGILILDDFDTFF